MGKTAKESSAVRGGFFRMFTANTPSAETAGSGAAATTAPAQTTLPAPELDIESIGSLWSNPWVWITLAVVFSLLLVGVWFWRKKKNSKAQDPLEPPAESGPDPAADWRRFFRGLPHELSRVLDQFETVFVLGDVASEKLEFVRQFSGNARRERQYGKRVSYVGEALNIYLGDRCLIIVPSDSFVDNEAARTDPRWRGVLKRTCRAHPPRVVVCLAPEVIKVGAAVSAWASKMRAHVDVISSVRGQAIPLSVVIAQPVGGAGERTDGVHSPINGLFELIASLRTIEGGPDLTRMEFVGIGGLLSGSEAQRRQVGQVWIQEKLEACHVGWPGLLAQPDAEPSDILGLATLFKEYESYTGNLGGGLAELLYVEDLDTAPLLPNNLYFLPWSHRQFVGGVTDFQGVQLEAGVRWYPTAVLRHRVAAATGFAVVALGVATHYSSERTTWHRAASYARNYDPQESMQRLETVGDYAAGGGLPGFYDRQLVRCEAVRKVRSQLRKDMAGQTTPEALLAFVSLYVTGTPVGCEFTGKEGPHLELNKLIEENLDRWHSVTKLQDEEIVAFMDLSCPSRTAPFPEIREAISSFGPMPEIPDVRQLMKTLQTLSKRCTLGASDETLLNELHAELDGLTSINGVGAEVLGIIEQLRDDASAGPGLRVPPTSHVAQELGPYRKRLELLSKARLWEEEVALVRRQLGPYLQAPELGPIDRSLLNAFVEQRGALQNVDVEPPITVDGESVELWRVRAAMRRRSLATLEESLVHAVRRGQSLFFSPAEMNQSYRWTSRRLGADGVSVRAQVPQRYTLQGFEAGVSVPLTRWAQFEDTSDCPGHESALTSRTTEFVRGELQAYLAAYGDVWLGVYQSFNLGLQTERQLLDALLTLSQATSPLRAMLEEIDSQTTWNVEKGFPFEADLASAASELIGLKSAADKKAQDEYAALMEELAFAAQTTAAPADASYGVDFDTTRQAFASKLSALGQIVLNSYADPTTDFRTRVNEWADSVHLPWRLRRPIAAPVREAYRLGSTNLQAEINRWWSQMVIEVEADVLKRFPFRGDSREPADVANVVRWLQPAAGRLDSELKPMLALLTGDCARVKDCFRIERPDGSDAVLSRLESIQKTLFDAEGEAKPLLFRPVPAWKSLRLVESRLTLGGQTVTFKDQAALPPPLEVTWSAPYAPRLEIQVCAPDLQGACERQQGRFEELDPSPWGLWELLAKAERTGSKFTWLVATPQGRVAVTYDVCAHPGGCEVLLSKVFDWR